MRINRKICVMIVALFLIGAFVPNVSVSAKENGLVHSNGTEKDGVYRLSQMFSDEMGMWQYYWYDGKASYSKMEYDAEGRKWQGRSPAVSSFISKDSWHTYVSGYTVAAFTCPKSGTVRIGTEQAVELQNVANTADGTIFIVMSDGEVLGTQLYLTKDKPKQEFEVVSMDVYEGQTIEFYLYMNVNNAGDSTKVLPFVEYTDYKAVEKKTIEKTDEVEEEPTLKTDIKPIEVPEEATFVIQPVQILIGAALVIVIGVVGLVLLVKKRGGHKKNEQN